VPSPNVGGISIYGAMHSTIDSVSVTNYKGQALYCRLSKDLTIRNSNTIGGQVLSEFASTVDLTVVGNHFSAMSPGCGLDLGAAFFMVSGNYVDKSANAGPYLLYGVHDGSVMDNQIASVASTIGSSAGMLIWGSQNIDFTGNYFAGGIGPDSVAKDIRPYTGEVPLSDANITLSGNTVGAWSSDVQQQ
jgi:hypothetical protein